MFRRNALVIDAAPNRTCWRNRLRVTALPAAIEKICNVYLISNSFFNAKVVEGRKLRNSTGRIPRFLFFRAFHIEKIWYKISRREPNAFF